LRFQVAMSEPDRLTGGVDWIELAFPERERTPEPIIEVGIQLHPPRLQIRSATPRQQPPNRGSRPSPSGTIDAKVNTTLCVVDTVYFCRPELSGCSLRVGDVEFQFVRRPEQQVRERLLEPFPFHPVGGPDDAERPYRSTIRNSYRYADGGNAFRVLL